ncbi:glycosyl hydrolase family 76-domain-containing protein [Sphaerosporella brunnea]|uniref:Glycosyl hydrolase family 76-domain-containing protein n=1 Tax=Sphaerosporella brunnea TaxID=1250544 RepID=A0A5J5F3E4_9PEZI|nr:glycosyl hydrolase family 76-domain-containing protein [Sphaerosporella brunnea]
MTANRFLVPSLQTYVMWMIPSTTMSFSKIKQRIKNHLQKPHDYPSAPPPSHHHTPHPPPPHSYPSPNVSAPLPVPVGPHTNNPFTIEGIRLCRATWQHFWDARHSHFVTEKASTETVGDWHGYTLWPFVIGIEALLEAEAAAPGQFTSEIRTAFEACEKYRSRQRRGAYTAWVWFEGNDDVYYDDDAQVAIALLKAYELPTLRDRVYLIRAYEIVTFLFTGWDHKRGGMRWHVDKPEARNACTTNLSAVAALKLAAALQHTGQDPRSFGIPQSPGVADLLQFARNCSDWVVNELSEESGLIKDGAGGGPTWTYNTGTALYTVCLLQQFRAEEELAQRAYRLAEAAVDRGKSLFDQSNPSVEHRYWWDSTFFVQLLVEGLVEFVQVFGEFYPETAGQARLELRRHCEYLMKYMKGRDGLYVRNLRLYVVSMDHLRMYQELTGDTGRGPALDASERWSDEASMKLPVEQRGICKTLLGCGGAARSLLIAGRIV